jgi:hypothetical protein
MYWEDTAMNAPSKDVNLSKALTAENAISVLNDAQKQGKPFIIEWRQSEEKFGQWEEESGAGCGCGCRPVE